MSDTDTPSKPPIRIRDPNNEQVKFVSVLGNFGCINGVVNVTLLTPRYVPPNFPARAEADLIVGSLLRMDLRLAAELRDALADMLEQNTETPKLAS